MSNGAGVLRAIDDGLAGLVATATRSLPEPTSHAQEHGQAELMLRLQLARASVASLLHIQSPARRDLSSAAVGAAADEITSTGGPAYITTLPSSATGRADQLPHFSWTVTFDPPLSWDWPC